MKNTEQLHILFQKYLDQSCSPDEMKQLLDYLSASEKHDELLEALISPVLEDQYEAPMDAESKRLLDAGFQQILAKRAAPQKRQAVLRQFYFRWAAAAAIFFIAVCTAVFYFYPQPVNETQATTSYVKFKPQTDKARLTLADGTVINLEQVAKGKINNKNGVVVTKTADGKLVYEAKAEQKNAAIAFNTLVTPRGGQYKIILPDGSAIWLNAASSLRFPTRFSGKERRVELNGEGYFEIAKNAAQPFIVTARGQEVTVLGTHFNVNAYAESNIIKTTLLEGAVKVSKDQTGYLLVPGEEAALNTSDNTISVAKNVDVNAAVAWKDGMFRFEATDIREVMHEVARWYDVDVRYKGDFTDVVLTGWFSRGDDVKKTLKLLKGTEQVDFVINGKTVTVIPYK
ncbi:transmembrane sensor [Pedobacter africanus]|uniref:Ferric-dicitrate binding protein FerR (Iron transport regulator) n=1 Tax=Pedobacter africanus TaxID=151894 RepID=A0ACC6KUX0_9SPHI|nr:FecR domain-containing protein [Pedobacter africanus]MDR6783129.1 ferric-dicitrate binding protein FerR (iron transport regulator) [Pedobacter africanus]